ncbi:MAG: hypothetical protein SPL45_05075, partial [Schwartzia succinivorans]|nr:hypothetical protein [Schwartzia succinivorans]
KAVTEDKAQACVDMAKETAPNFADDVKQVTEDRDTSSFFKKNNQRNTKIVAGLIAIIVVMFVAFWGSSKYEKEAIIEAETQAGLLSDIASVHSSRVIVKAQKDDLMDYLIFVDTTNKLKRKMKLAYMVVVNMKTDKKKAVYLGYVSKDGDKAVVEKYKEYLKSDGFTIK